MEGKVSYLLFVTCYLLLACRQAGYLHSAIILEQWKLASLVNLLLNDLFGFIQLRIAVIIIILVG